MRKAMVLTTTRPIHGVTKDDKKSKPTVIKLYDFKKGGADTVDQLNDYYASRRWDMIAFCYVLDKIRVNTKTAWCIYEKGTWNLRILSVLLEI